MLEAIEWLDHNTQIGWKDHSEVSAEGLRCISVGWIIDENPKVVMLGATLGGGESVQRMNILKADIIKRYKLKDPTPVKKAFHGAKTAKKGTT